MKDFGLVSIITASYNTARFIGETIEAIRKQTYTNWELLITDDCSPDESNQIIESYVVIDPRIRLLKMNINSGAAAARNNSITHAKGRYIAFCDSDDLWFPEKLERQLNFMMSHDLPLTYSSSLWCREDGTVFAINPAYARVSFKEICNCDKIGMSSLIYDSDKLNKVYIPTLKNREDWALKIKLLEQIDCARGMLETLIIYRFRDNSLSRNKIKNIKFNVQVYEKVLNMNLLMAWLKFLFNFMPCQIRKKIRQKISNSRL